MHFYLKVAHSHILLQYSANLFAAFIAVLTEPSIHPCVKETCSPAKYTLLLYSGFTIALEKVFAAEA